MGFGNVAAIQADVEFRANYAQFEGDNAKIRESAERTYGALDQGALKAALASEKYDRAIARARGSAYAIAKATAAYKAELASLESAQNRASTGAARHGHALQDEERSLGRMARGAIVGSGALGHLGRAAIFASSSLLGGYGLVYGLRTVIGAAKEQEVALGHLQVAVTDSGLAWTATKGKVDDALSSLVKTTAFTKDELTEALATAVRRFGDVDQAVDVTALASDVARAKNIDLAGAMNLVIRASFGQSRAAKALGVDVSTSSKHLDALRAVTKNATTEQIANAKAADQQANRTAYLDQIQAKYHGNAARYLQTSAGKQALFNSELRESEEIIGSALLPTFNHYLGHLTDWLQKMNQSGRLQCDVNSAVKHGAEVIHGLDDAVHAAAGPVRIINGLLGGTTHTVKLLALAFAAAKLGVLPALFRNVGASIKVVGANAAVAAGEVNGLATAEGRAAAASGFGNGLGFATGAGPFSRAGQIPNRDLRAGGGGGSGLGGVVGAILLGGFGAIPDTQNGVKLVTGGDYFGKPPTPGERFKGKDGKIYFAYYTPGGKLGFVSADDLAQARQAKNATATNEQNPRAGVPGSPTSGGAGGSGSKPPPPGSPTVGLSYAQQNKLLATGATTSTADDDRVLRDEISILNRQLTQKGLTPQQRNEILTARNEAISQLQSDQQQNAQSAAEAARKRAAAAAAAARRRKQLFTGQTVIPAKLVKQLADAQRTGKPLDTIVGIIRQEEAALRRQGGELRREGAPESYEAKIAVELKRLHDEIQKAILADRRKRIAKLDEIPTSLKLEEANALANNASAERLLAIRKKEKAALDKQLAELKKIHATKAEILKNRLAAAAVQKKINEAEKQQKGDQAALARELHDAVAGLADYAPNVTEALATLQGGTQVHVHQTFPSAPSPDGRREAIYARHAMEATFDG